MFFFFFFCNIIMDNLFKVCPVLDTRMERKISWKYVLSCTYMCLEVATWEWIYIYIYKYTSFPRNQLKFSEEKYLDISLFRCVYISMISCTIWKESTSTSRIRKNRQKSLRRKIYNVEKSYNKISKKSFHSERQNNVVTYFNQISPKIITCLLLRKENFKIFPKIITICPFRKNCNSLKILIN